MEMRITIESKEAFAFLDKIGGRAMQETIRKSLKRTVRAGRAEALRLVLRDLNVEPEAAQKGIKLSVVRANDTSATITFRQKPISLARFSAKRKRLAIQVRSHRRGRSIIAAYNAHRYGFSVEVKRGRRKVVSRTTAFVAPLRFRQRVNKGRGQPPEYVDKTAEHVLERGGTTKTRGLQKLVSMSIRDYFQNRDNFRLLEGFLSLRFREAFDKEYARVLKKMGT